MSSSGTITVRPLAASLQHDVDLFGKMDPYCLITLGTQQWKSQICKNGGKTPTWNDEVSFMVQPGVDIMRVALYDDKLIGSDKLIAEGVIPVDKLFSFSSPFEEKIPLTFKTKPCGFIQLRFFANVGQQNFQQNLGQQNIGYAENLGQQNLGQQNLGQQNLGQQPLVGQDVLIVQPTGEKEKHKIKEQQFVTTENKTAEFVQNLPQQQIPTAGASTFTSQSVQHGPKVHETKYLEKEQQMSVQPGVVLSTGTTLPQCCISAIQQSNPSWVQGMTYTGNIPQHQHLFQQDVQQERIKY
jgi:hypothetical protein